MPPNEERRLFQEIVQFREAMLALAVKRQTRLVGGEATKDPRFRHLLESVSFRTQAVVWHTDLLADHYAQYRSFAARDRATALQLHQDNAFLEHARGILAFVFDDVVFNAVSVFDYIGQLTGYVFTGKDDPMFEWARLVKEARRGARGARCSYPAELSAAVVKADDEWLDTFREFRHRSIHREMQRGDAVHSMDLDTVLDGPEGSAIALDVFLPERIRHRLAGFLPEGPRPVDILVGTEAITRRTLVTAAEIVRAFEASL